jgi:3-hydroxyisobutyrate dehydrogenase
MHIGWVGLGSIGAGMVTQALKAGLQVTVYARGQGLEQVEAAGAAVSSDYAALAAECDVLGLCVFSDAQLREVLFEGGALSAMRPGTVVAIHTTGSPDLAREIGARAPEGVSVLDATFSGGPAQVAAGELTLMVGGEAEGLERARPLLEIYANKIHHVGALGKGQTIKLLNNLIFASNVQHAAEVLATAEQQGFDTWQAARIFQDCSGSSFAMGMFQAQAPSSRVLTGVKPYLQKDVATAVSSAAAAGIDLGAFASTADYYRKL